MADYRLSVQVISRSSGRSVVAAAAYRSGAEIADERTGEVHDYTRRGGVEGTEIILPSAAGEWARDRAQLWNAAEQAERRQNSQTAREIQLSLPHELSSDERKAVVRAFVAEQLTTRGMVADVAYHLPGRDGDDRNFHAHILVATREVGRDGFGAKNREWNTKQTLAEWREAWATIQNRALEAKLGKDAPRVSHLSHAERGIAREPTRHLGPTAAAMERRGAHSDRGNHNRRAVHGNEARAQARVAARHAQITAAPNRPRQIESVIAELSLRSGAKSDEIAKAKRDLQAVLDDRKAAARLPSKKTIEAQILGQSKDRLSAAEKAARDATARLVSTPLAVELSLAQHAPATYLLLKMNKALDAIQATVDAREARRDYDQRTRAVRSPATQKMIATAQEARASYSRSNRTDERRLRRAVARATRDGATLARAYQQAQHVKAAGVSEIQAPTVKVTEAAYRDELFMQVARAAKALTPEQWERARQNIREQRAEREQGRG